MSSTTPAAPEPSPSTGATPRSSQRLRDKGPRNVIVDDSDDDEDDVVIRKGRRRKQSRRAPDTSSPAAAAGGDGAQDTAPTNAGAEAAEESGPRQPWELDENRIPEADRRVDENKFAVSHAWDGGLRYERPDPRHSGFISIAPEEPEEVVGNVEPWWKGELPGWDTRLYEDRYSQVVRLSRPWALSPLPPPGALDWELKYRMPIPGDWAEDLSCEALLRSLGFRPPHQSHFRLSAKDVLAARASVFAHAMADIDMVPDTAMWQSLGRMYFKGRRQELDAQGYIVEKGFVLRESVGDQWEFPDGAQKTATAGIRELFEHFENQLPDPNAAMTVQIEDMWGKIRNTKRTTAVSEMRNVRWQSTAQATNTELEAAGTEALIKARCMVEVSVWVFLHFLHLEGATFDDVDGRRPNELPRLEATDSGSRFLASGPACADQIAHTDFMHTSNVQTGDYPETVTYPGYFMIQMGSEPGALWVLQGSHRFVFLTPQDEKTLAKVIGMTIVKIPAWSLFLGRGDLVHGGCGTEQCGGRACMRMHDYALRDGVPFVDTIFEKPSWRHFSN